MACFYSVRKEDQCARQCHMLLLSPERWRQSLGSAGIHFRWKWWGQQPIVKNYDDMFSSFDRIPACDRRTDRRTDILRQRSPRYAQHLAVKISVAIPGRVCLLCLALHSFWLSLRRHSFDLLRFSEQWLDWTVDVVDRQTNTSVLFNVLLYYETSLHNIQQFRETRCVSTSFVRDPDIPP